MALAGAFDPYAYQYWDLDQKRDFIAPARNLGNAQVQLSDRLYRVKMDVRQFSPEEVVVRTENGELVVEGQHEIKDDYGLESESGDSFTARSFVRRFILPEMCKERELHAEIGTDGILTVKIPRVQDVGVSAVQTHEIKHSIPHPQRALHPVMKGFHLPGHCSPWNGWPWTWHVTHDDDLDSIVSGFTRTKEHCVYRLKVPQFSPDELIVKTQDEFLIIEGAHESKKDGHGCISRAFIRKYVLPVDTTTTMDDIICQIDKKGVLSVTLPRFVPQRNNACEERTHKVVLADYLSC